VTGGSPPPPHDAAKNNTIAPSIKPIVWRTLQV